MEKHFLLVYDRPKTNLLSMVEYADGDEALDARFAAERAYRGNPDVEVVVLSGESEELIRDSHARYFYSMQELLDRLIRTFEARLRVS